MKQTELLQKQNLITDLEQIKKEWQDALADLHSKQQEYRQLLADLRAMGKEVNNCGRKRPWHRRTRK